MLIFCSVSAACAFLIYIFFKYRYKVVFDLLYFINKNFGYHIKVFFWCCPGLHFQLIPDQDPYFLWTFRLNVKNSSQYEGFVVYLHQDFEREDKDD